MRRNTAWAFAGNSIYAGCQWAVFVMLVKTLRAEEAGTAAYATALTGPVFVLATVRLRNLLATSSASACEFPDYLRARLLTPAAAVALSLAIATVGFRQPGSLAIIAIVAAGRACEAISDICHGLFQRELDMRSPAVGLGINAVLSVALVAAVLLIAPSLRLAIAAYAAASLLALACWDLPRARALLRRVRATLPNQMTPHNSYAAAWRLLVTASPMGLSSAVGSIQTNLPRYVIAAVLGPAALAIFAAISYVTMAGHLIVNATSQAALPMLAIDARNSPQQFRARLGSLVAATLAAGALTIGATLAFGGAALSLIYGTEYAQYSSVLVWLVVATIVSFTSVFLGTGTTARHRFGAQSLVSLTALGVVAGSIGPLVSRYGLLGAAWSLLAGAIAELAAYAWLTVRDLRPAQDTSTIVSGALPDGAQP
jgi:O-antigen/teichoic acid export membrane protein